jgi:hypothetical protein
MKRLISSTLIVLALSGCLIPPKVFDKYAHDPYVIPHLPVGEEVLNVDSEEIDVDKDGKPDAKIITINTSGENLQRVTQVVHGYKDGKLLEHPYSIIDFAEKSNEQKGLGTLNEYYDCGTKKLNNRNELPEDVLKFKPDGIIDYHEQKENFTPWTWKFKIFVVPSPNQPPKPLPQQKEIRKQYLT